jgi:PBSX family phage terminase large subunit
MDKPSITFTAKQTRLWKLLDNIKYRRYLIDGSARSGKTLVIISWLLNQMATNPGIRIACLRQHRNAARITLFNGTIKGILKGRSEFSYSDTAMEIYHSNGSVMRVDGLDQADRAEKILGDEFGHIFINEATQVSYQALSLAISRLAQNLPTLKKRVCVLDCNPRGTFHWLYSVGVLNVDPVERKPLADKEIWARMNFIAEDNPFLPTDTILSLKALIGTERKRLYEGKWCSIENLVYPTFNIDRHVKDMNSRLTDKWMIGIDCGLSDPTVIALFNILKNDKGDNSLYLSELYYEAGKDMSKSISAECSKYKTLNPEIVVDPSASPAIIELKANDFNVEPANNKIDDGIKTVNDLLNTDRLFINPNCSNHVIEEISQYEMNIKTEKPIGNTPDHVSDCIRYVSVAFMSKQDTSTPFYIF